MLPLHASLFKSLVPNSLMVPMVPVLRLNIISYLLSNPSVLLYPLFLLESSHSFFELVHRMAEALKIQMDSDAPKTTDIVHQLVQADVPLPAILPLLLVDSGILWRL